MSTESITHRSTRNIARLGPWLRAVLLLGLVVLNTLATVPSFGTASAERLQRPFEQEELGRWHAQVQRWGLAFASKVAEARALVLAPLSWWTSWTQTVPGWNLFGTPDDFSPAFRLSVSEPSGERVLYESGVAERSWQASLLGYRRLRASYNPSRSGTPSTYPGVCQRLSERVFAEQPLVAHVRCSIVRRAVPLPGQAPRLEPEEQQVIEVTRPQE
jgi:hypothetical protein